jgi:MFS family permease
MVLDSSVMNVSISQIVADLDTTIQGVQLAITAYTLVMAALMLAGAKLGDILGRDRDFALGLAIYGLGSLTTALSPNLGVLLLGWSLDRGLGRRARDAGDRARWSRRTYSGKQRALAFGIVGGVAGAAIAAGPLIGGWVTTEFSWRYVFAGEAVIVAAILLVRRALRAPGRRPPPAARRRRRAHLRLGSAWPSSASSRAARGADRAARRADDRGHRDHAVRLLVRAVLHPARASAASPASRCGRSGASAGAGHAAGPDAAADPPLRAGLLDADDAAAAPAGHFFVLPVYLQVVLGLDAFDTGKRLFPMSVDDVHRGAWRAASSRRLRPQARWPRPGLVAHRVAASCCWHDRRRAQRGDVRDRARRCSAIGRGCCCPSWAT